MNIKHQPGKKNDDDIDLVAARNAINSAPEPDPNKPTLPSQIKDEATRLAVARKLLASEKQRVSIRGFEVARLNPNGEWESVMKGKLPYMAATAAWLNDRHPNTLYQARVLVSAEIPDRPDAVKDAVTSLAEKMGVEQVDGPPSEQSTPTEDAPAWDLADARVAGGAYDVKEPNE